MAHQTQDLMEMFKRCNLDITYKKVWEAKAGEFYDIEHYDKIINHTSKGFKEDGSVLFYLVKNNIGEEKLQEYKDTIRSCARAKTKNRGSSAGACDLRYFPKRTSFFCVLY